VKRRYLPTLLLSLIGTVACGGNNEASNDDTGKGGSGIGHTGGSGGSSAAANGGTGNIMIVQGGSAGTGGTSGIGGGQACATETLGADVGPVNMFVMFDSSGSMNEDDKWPSATSAFSSFFQDPATAGLRVAFRFFGSNQPTRGCNNQECSIDACADPLIDIATLTAESAPSDTHESALVNLMQTSSAVGGFGTPIYPALGGAVKWASEYAAANPNENAVILFVTDGEPNGCNQDIGDIAALAADGWDLSKVRTYAIGLEGSNESQLEQIATAGNTEHGYFIGAGATAGQDLLNALNEIRASAIRCDVAIPASTTGERIDFNRVNVNYTPSAGEAVAFGKVPTAADCSSLEGWHYDDPSAPTRIVLCQSACERVNADSGAELSIVLGCQSEPAVPR
jgi:hypothetical protein